MLTIQVDTREHKSEWERIQKQFDDLNIQYFRSKLFCGDYQSLDNARLVIDRKRDLQELCGNVCQQHKRFKQELVRAMKNGIKIIRPLTENETTAIAAIIIGLVLSFFGFKIQKLVIIFAWFVLGFNLGNELLPHVLSDKTIITVISLIVTVVITVLQYKSNITLHKKNSTYDII